MWVKLKHFDNYEVNILGQVRRAGRILKTSLATNGYINVCVCKNGKAKTLRLHRVIAEAFIPNPDNKLEVNHIDGIRTNNAISNLEWSTRSENRLHAYHVTKNHVAPRSMLGRFGKNHNRSKSFAIKYPDGKTIKYESGLEFKRLTGLDHSSISWARSNKCSGYKFAGNRGLKGLIVYF